MDNCDPISDENSESSHREFAHGKYYNGNKTKNPRTVLSLEGSQGLMVNQGAERWSMIPDTKDEDNSPEEIKSFEKPLTYEGSHTAFGKMTGSKVSREI